jgi:hypothetical protein
MVILRAFGPEYEPGASRRLYHDIREELPVSDHHAWEQIKGVKIKNMSIVNDINYEAE